VCARACVYRIIIIFYFSSSSSFVSRGRRVKRGSSGCPRSHPKGSVGPVSCTAPTRTVSSSASRQYAWRSSRTFSDDRDTIAYSRPLVQGTPVGKSSVVRARIIVDDNRHGSRGRVNNNESRNETSFRSDDVSSRVTTSEYFRSFKSPWLSKYD